MKILVVECGDQRRADIVDAICELPGIEVHAQAAGLADSRMLIACEPIDLVVTGDLPMWEIASLDIVAEAHACPVLAITTVDELVRKLGVMGARRDEPRTSLTRLTARTKYLAFERDTQQACPTTLAHHLRAGESGPSRRGVESIDLREWLPLAVAQLRPFVPDYIELVPMVAADTLAVQCVPAVLEHMLMELVLQACVALPWGGTVWLTAAPGEDGEVKLDVLENGLGQVRDLTLRASAPAGS